MSYGQNFRTFGWASDTDWIKNSQVSGATHDAWGQPGSWSPSRILQFADSAPSAYFGGGGESFGVDLLMPYPFTASGWVLMHARHGGNRQVASAMLDGHAEVLPIQGADGATARDRWPRLRY